MTEKESQMDTTDSKATASEACDATTTAASASASTYAQPEDEFIAQKVHAVEQLYNVFGFSYAVAQQAVEYIAETTTPPSSSSIDITACYNYILDSGLGQDHGGPVTPIDDCPHVTNHFKISIEQIPIQPSHTQCSFVLTSSSTSTDDTTSKPKGNLKSDLMYEEQDGGDTIMKDTTSTSSTTGSPFVCKGNENWLCLECGVVRCSRYCLGHALQHLEESRQPVGDGHCVAVSLSDLSVWCHICQAYVSTHAGSTGHVIQPLVSQLEYNKFHLEGDTTIVMDTTSPVPPHTKKIKHNHDDDIDVDADETVPSGDELNNTEQAVDDNVQEENGKSFHDL